MEGGETVSELETEGAGEREVEVEVPVMCERHRYDLLVDRLKIPPHGPWMVAEVTMQIMLFQAATADERIQARTGGDPHSLSLVLNELGCLACWERKWYKRALLIIEKGVSYAAKVAQGKFYDPDWIFTREQLREDKNDG